MSEFVNISLVLMLLLEIFYFFVPVLLQGKCIYGSSFFCCICFDFLTILVELFVKYIHIQYYKINPNFFSQKIFLLVTGNLINILPVYTSFNIY